MLCPSNHLFIAKHGHHSIAEYTTRGNDVAGMCGPLCDMLAQCSPVMLMQCCSATLTQCCSHMLTQCYSTTASGFILTCKLCSRIAVSPVNVAVYDLILRLREHKYGMSKITRISMSFTLYDLWLRLRVRMYSRITKSLVSPLILIYMTWDCVYVYV